MNHQKFSSKVKKYAKKSFLVMLAYSKYKHSENTKLCKKICFLLFQRSTAIQLQIPAHHKKTVKIILVPTSIEITEKYCYVTPNNWQRIL